MVELVTKIENRGTEESLGRKMMGSALTITSLKYACKIPRKTSRAQRNLDIRY